MYKLGGAVVEKLGEALVATHATPVSRLYLLYLTPNITLPLPCFSHVTPMLVLPAF